MSMVEWKKLGDVCEIKTGKGITQKDCTDDGTYPVISGGQSPMGMFKQYNREAETVTISRVGAYAGFVSFIDKRFYLNDKCFSIIPFKHLTLHSRYLYIVLKSQEEKIKKLQSEGGVPTINTQKLAKLQIPFPSLSEQSRIVSILDTFTASIENLKEQIAERRKQYEYEREKLLDLEGKENKSIKCWGEFCEILKGNGVQKADFTESGNGCIHYGQIYTYYGAYTYTTNKYVSEEVFEKAKRASNGDLIMTDTSENVEDICKTVAYLGKDDIAVSNHTFILKHKENPKFLSFSTQTNCFFAQKRQYVVGAKVSCIRPTHFARIKIYLPPLSEQSRIVSILDTFEASIANLEAQLELRQKQYEYYRNQLLTFK